MIDGSATAPTNTQVKAGNGEDGAAADLSGSYAVASGENDDTIDDSTLADGTWHLHITVEDAAGNLSAVSSVSYTKDTTATAPSIVASSDSSAETTSATSLTISGYNHGAGSNRKVIVFAGGFNATIPSGNTLSCTYDGTAMEQVGEVIGLYEQIVIFQALEATLPAGGSGDVVLTSGNSMSNLAMSVFTVQDAKQEAASGMTVEAASAASDSITPPEASCLVLGFGHGSISSTNADWTAGLTRYALAASAGAGAYAYGGTSTILVGSSTQGASALTCTHDMSTGRPSIILATVEPV